VFERSVAFCLCYYYCYMLIQVLPISNCFSPSSFPNVFGIGPSKLLLPKIYTTNVKIIMKYPEVSYEYNNRSLDLPTERIDIEFKFPSWLGIAPESSWFSSRKKYKMSFFIRIKMFSYVSGTTKMKHLWYRFKLTKPHCLRWTQAAKFNGYWSLHSVALFWIETAP